MRFTLPFLLALALLLVACEDQPDPIGFDEPDTPEMDTTMPDERDWSNALSEDDIDTMVRLGVGEELVVRLESNVTTGHAWQVHEIGDNIRAAREAEYIPIPTEEEMVGSGGHEVWRFEGVTPGESMLELHYRQPFNDEGESARTWRVNVIVE